MPLLLFFSLWVFLLLPPLLVAGVLLTGGH